MKTIKLILVSFFFINYSSSQIKLPEVPNINGRGFFIKGTYVPRDEFISTFPNFLSNGIYLFDYDNSIPETYSNFDKSFYRGLYNFNSKEFPVNEEKSTNNLSGLGKILIQFTSDCDISKDYFSKIKLGTKRSYLDKADLIVSKTDVDYYRNVINLDKNIKEHYEKLNNLFNKSVTIVFEKLKTDRFAICDLGTLAITDTSFCNADIILQFVYVQSNIWGVRKSTNAFPSHALYKLIVKNIFGDIINSYGQGIFIEARGYESDEPVVLNTTFPIAFENLLNRFLNDYEIIEKIKSDRTKELSLRNNSPHYDSLVLYRNKYNIIRSKKQQLLFDLYSINNDYDVIADENSDRENSVINRDKSLDNNAVAALITAHNNGSLSKDIKYEIEQNQKKLFVLQQIASEIDEEEKKFIKELYIKIQHSDFIFILNSKEADDIKLNTLLSKLTNKNQSTFEAFENTSKNISSDLGPVFSATINSLLKQNGVSLPATSPSVESSAITNSGTSLNNMDVCQQQATTLWYKSVEYKTYMQTTLNSDASDCKAKLIELTVQFCGDKLSPKELAEMKQAAVGERKVANDLRVALKNVPQFKH